MYQAYTCNIDLTDLKISKKTFDDSVGKEFEKTVESLDRFIYFIDLYQVMQSCAEDLVCFSVPRKNDFWKVNKYLLNYVNAVYSFKEYIENAFKSNRAVPAVSNSYFLNNQWYAFICNYRNRIIHQSAIAKDYDWNSGEIFIHLDELIEYQKEQLRPDEKKNINCRNAIRFMEDQLADSLLINGAHYLRIRNVVKKVSIELASITNEICDIIFDADIKPRYEWLFSIVLRDESGYKNTVIAPEGSREAINPTYVLEEYFVNVILALGDSFDVTMKMKSLFDEKGYQYLFNYQRDLNDLVMALKQTEEENN